MVIAAIGIQQPCRQEVRLGGPVQELVAYTPYSVAELHKNFYHKHVSPRDTCQKLAVNLAIVHEGRGQITA
jgi:hypothetical protein